MAILKIARMGHPILRRKADPVADPTAPEIHRLVRDMLETMEEAGGTGLAAPQVHVPLRVVVFFVAPGRAAAEDAGAPDDEITGDDNTGAARNGAGAGQAVPLTILINPEIEVLDPALSLGPEACLSVPGLVGQVPRPRRIRYSGLTLEGERLEREAAGFHARVVLHECDHLDGVLYPQRMTDLSRLSFAEEALRHAAAAQPAAAQDTPSNSEVLEAP
ncbi:MAG TPA: peptide deformylase [Kiloniellaceae bacterium]|nr:peptide deformylase [Kiloniellaceae bacterium]HIP78323.1 peptide deformylase [Kiloniellaceae bacterium]